MNIADMIRELLSGKGGAKGINAEPQKKYPVPDFIKKAQAEPTKIADPYSMSRAQRKAAQRGFVKTGQSAKAAPNRFADIKDFYGDD